MVVTRRMQDLEDKFEEEIVQRAANIRDAQKPYHMERNNRPNWKDAHKCCM